MKKGAGKAAPKVGSQREYISEIYLNGGNGNARWQHRTIKIRWCHMRVYNGIQLHFLDSFGCDIFYIPDIFDIRIW